MTDERRLESFAALAQSRHRVFAMKKRTNWGAPPDLFFGLEREFGFTLDPAPRNPDFDGLAISWHNERVFCNPPYGRGIEKWLTKGIEEPEIAVFLLFARTDTGWFHDLVLPNATALRFIRRRLRFDAYKWDAPMPSIVVLFERGRRGPPRVELVPPPP